MGRILAPRTLTDLNSNRVISTGLLAPQSFFLGAFTCYCDRLFLTSSQSLSLHSVCRLHEGPSESRTELHDRLERCRCTLRHQPDWMVRRFHLSRQRCQWLGSSLLTGATARRSRTTRQLLPHHILPRRHLESCRMASS